MEPTEFLNLYLLSVTIASLLANVAISLYGVFYKPHYTKKIIAVSILGDSVNTIAIFIGFRRWLSPSQPSSVAIATNLSREGIEKFANVGVDPLPQALVLTAIVIGLAVTLFLIYLGYMLYCYYKTLDMREIRRLKG
jgi:multicomponent Na+:H+ antiporter subunit C